MAISRFSTSSVAQGLPKYQLLKTNPSEVTNGLQVRLDAGSYSGSGSWLDTSGNSRNGTLANTTFTSNGASSYFNFNGSNSYVDLSQTAYVGSGGSPLTAEIWIYIGNALTSSAYIMPIRIKQDNEFFCVIGDNAGTFYANAVFRGSTQWGLTSGISRATMENQWIQWVITYSGGDKSTASSYKFYRNGVSLGSGSANYSGAGGSSNWNALGKDSSGTGVADGTGNGALNGRIANYKLYNRALSDSEILQNFNALRGRYNI